MRSLLYALLVGLAGAALLHIVIILSLPSFTGRDAYTRVEALGELHRFFPLANGVEQDILPVNDDPALLVAACQISTVRAPARLFAEANVPFWSLAVFDSAANEVFSMNDRTSVTGDVDVVVATPIQLTSIRKALPDDLLQSILVEMEDNAGYVVLRTFIPTESHAEAARAFLAAATCEELEGR